MHHHVVRHGVLGFAVNREAVSGCLTDFDQFIPNRRPLREWLQELFDELLPPNIVKQMTIHFTWFHERFRVLPADTSEETVRIYVRAYIMILLSTQFFDDKNGNRVHLQWLLFLVRLDELGKYSSDSDALA
ncbi:uncharacterized protein DS421_3g105480 [Arachis hypogaea]|nr:uncharacterized protein DS421_3g105480 [Arachis hypogaea]